MWDEATIAVLFCNTGVQRSAVFYALYQHYNNKNNSNLDLSALDRVFSIGRIRESIGLPPLSLRPSWTTLIAFAEKEFRMNKPPSLPKPFLLSHVVVNLSVLKPFLFSKNSLSACSESQASFIPQKSCTIGRHCRSGSEAPRFFW